jgi:hypothetical protein
VKCSQLGLGGAESLNEIIGLSQRRILCRLFRSTFPSYTHSCAKAARLDYWNISAVTALVSLGAGVSATGILGFAAAAVFAVVIPRVRHRRNY